MLKKIVLLAIMSSVGMAMAQDITGKWRTVDDKTKKPKAVVQITKNGNVYSGRIISLEAGVDPNCGDCSGEAKGKPLVGKTVLRGLKDDGDGGYEKGQIIDPKNGNTYTAAATLENGGNTLNVRAYIGVKFAGRTQSWQRVK